jgi:hypothetical protein
LAHVLASSATAGGANMNPAAANIAARPTVIVEKRMIAPLASPRFIIRLYRTFRPFASPAQANGPRGRASEGIPSWRLRVGGECC